MTPDDATLAQIAAADPKRSTWLSANAGSGKTRVLTDRVARLLLDGVSPQRILCLTYTKAAASEMQNRLFQRLGAWAMMRDDDLRTSLSELGIGEDTFGAEKLAQARRLFAKAIETPGGLKIQTIHSFCASLLRRFPLESGVSPAFVEMDDRAAKMLRADVLEQIALDAPDVMARFARYFSDEDPDGFLAEITKQRELFETPVSDADLFTAYDLPQNYDAAQLLSDVFLGDEKSIIDALVPLLRESGKNDLRVYKALSPLDISKPDLLTLEALEKAFLTQSGANAFRPAKQPPTKAVRDALEPIILEQLDQFRERVADHRPKRLALAAIAKARALHDLAGEVIPRIDAAKSARGLLDFEDLIRRARALLTDPSVAAWVLFRLDGGIDHLLVDEAQDTSPDQWAVIKLLAEEFTAGQGARAEPRTIFVVGDPKQSIYSFQGADPAAFDEMRMYFDTALARIQQNLQQRDLLYSFRSASPILQLVDQTFQEEQARGMGQRIEHKAFETMMPGRVDLWDWIDGDTEEDDTPWYDPVDQISQDHHSVQLAEKIAEFIADRIKHGQITTKKGTRAITAGDFLILVQGRLGIFGEIIRACKARGLPMAGADVLKIGAELGVRDLTALLSYLATPEDDLSLATVLRSPLCGLGEDELHRLAQGRPTYLRAALEARKDQFPAAYDMLQDLRGKADYMRPYDLLERCLTRHHGRANLIARLGPEAEEGIAALLDQAQVFERSSIPGLTAFLEWLAGDEVTIKRQIDANQDQIRVMTVHGAKGLEAPIVILPETMTKPEKLRDDILDADGIAAWKAKSEDLPPLQTALVDSLKAKQAEERLRLFYVAMTRAESWLVICGSGKIPKDDASAWYRLADTALQEAGAEPQPGVKWRLDGGDWPPDVGENSATADNNLPDLAAHFHSPVASPARKPTPLSPSKLGGAKALPGSSDALSEDAAKARGTAIHRLLEHLPNVAAKDRQSTAEALVGPQAKDLLPQIERLLATPELAFIFAPGTLAEVAVTARINGRVVMGEIDRLIVSDTKILAIDFKSNATVPQTPQDTPDGILRQMGAYAEALRRIYPDRDIETAILWTETAYLMPLPHDIVRDALAAAHIS